jgi:hypothetical protein
VQADSDAQAFDLAIDWPASLLLAADDDVVLAIRLSLGLQNLRAERFLNRSARRRGPGREMAAHRRMIERIVIETETPQHPDHVPGADGRSGDRTEPYRGAGPSYRWRSARPDYATAAGKKASRAIIDRSCSLNPTTQGRGTKRRSRRFSLVISEP